MQQTRKTHLHPHVGHARQNWAPRLSLQHEIQVPRRSRILSLRPLTNQKNSIMFSGTYSTRDTHSRLHPATNLDLHLHRPL